MMENHSYDNYLGMLRRGDGFTLDKKGRPTAVNRTASGQAVPAFHLASTCQLAKQPTQTWDASHIQYDNGRNDGFVRSGSGPISMGYWEQQDLPFYYGLASTFPLADRYFSSVLAQTYPNRRFLLAGTAYGLVDNRLSSVTAPPPPNGTIFDRLNQHSITWKNYFSSLASGLLINGIHQKNPDKLVPIAQFYKDAAAGTLPSYSLVDPDFDKSSEENPQNILVGEAFAAGIINAVMNGPLWPKTMLIWCYDEHGGYYDHVPPPAAIAPDSIPPNIAPQTQPGGYDRYGFRVPAVDRLPAGAPQLRLACGARPHVDPQADRDEVEPAGVDLSRLGREQPARLDRPDRHTRFSRTAEAAGTQPEPGGPGMHLPGQRAGCDLATIRSSSRSARWRGRSCRRRCRGR